MSNKRVAITVDVEDWFQVENLREHFPPEKWSVDLVRFKKPLSTLLDLLDKHGIRVTFFILGWLAERFPETVKAISERGHEVASHGMSHRLNSQLSYEELHAELIESKQMLEKITGNLVLGYRAPSFTISDTLLKALHQADYLYDSSLFPFSKHQRYGRISPESLKDAKKNGIIEFEIELGRFLGKQIPYAGGAYFRILPFWLIKRLLLNSESTIIVMYFHPWEFDPDQPRVRGLSLGKKLRHLYGLRRNLQKVEKLICLCKSSGIGFITLAEAQKTIDQGIHWRNCLSR